MAPADPEAKRREAGLRLASAVQLKTFLRYQGLVAGLNDTKVQVVKRYLRYVEEGKLEGELVDRAIVEFLEYRNKRIYLYMAEPSRLARLDLSRFTRRIDSWAGAQIVLQPSSPRENYSYITPDVVRVTFSETHRQPIVDLVAERVAWRDVGKVIVLDANRKTGFVSLSFDSPGRIHPRGSRSVAYFSYYKGRAEALLGSQLEPFDLQPALTRIEAGNLIRLPQRRASGLDGSVDIVARIADVREMPAFQATDSMIPVKDSGRYIWLPQPPAIMREVPTAVEASTSMVRFTKDSLVQEVQYVLEQIQANS